MKSDTLSLKTSIKRDLLLLVNKVIEKVPYPHNAKDHYQSFIRNTKPQNQLLHKFT